MSWRVVIIANRAKLDYKLGYMVIRGMETTKIHLSEISILMIETTEVSVTVALLSELTKSKVKVIFCDEKRNPSSELVSYYGCHDTSLKIRQQIKWSETSKENAWTEIVTEKIRKQKALLEELGYSEANLLAGYIKEMAHNDATNREGHAAKVYFNAIFGMDFSRTQDIPINSALNYGYGLVLSAVNREIVKSGYITQIGLFHDNVFNQFNLGSDIMEPFRPLVDKAVLDMNPVKFERDEKIELINILNKTVYIDGKEQYVNNAIGVYCRSVFDALNEDDVSLIRFYRNEL